MESFIRVHNPIFPNYPYEFIPHDVYDLEGVSDDYYTFSYKGYKCLVPKEPKEFETVYGQNKWLKECIDDFLKTYRHGK